MKKAFGFAILVIVFFCLGFGSERWHWHLPDLTDGEWKLISMVIGVIIGLWVVNNVEKRQKP